MSQGFHGSLIHGVPLGRLPFPPRSGRRVELRAHWLLLLVPVGELLGRGLAPTAPFGAPFLSWGASMAALLAALALHELGHLLWMSRQGGHAERVILGPLGGVASGDLPEEPRPHLQVALAGIAATALGLGASIAACVAGRWELLPPATVPEAFPYLQAVCQYLVLWNGFLLLNLLPCSPLDGGRVLEALLWSRLESRWQARLVARKVSLAAAIGAGTAAVFLFFASLFLGKDYALHHPFLLAISWGLVLVAAMAYLDFKLEELRDHAGEEDPGVFGYDFSGGYTSLERKTARRSRKSRLWNRLRDGFRRRSRARREQGEQTMKQELDELLRKIHDQGMDSLTPAERRFLHRASKQMRK